MVNGLKLNKKFVEPQVCTLRLFIFLHLTNWPKGGKAIKCKTDKITAYITRS